MNATEARKKSDSYNKGTKEEQLNFIYNEINIATNKGKYEIMYFNKLENGVRETLSLNGFIIGKEIYDRDGYFVRISW